MIDTRPPLRYQRFREPFWRWRVWAIYQDGWAMPITRSGFWTRGGAARFADSAEWNRRIQGGDWQFEVRSERA